MIETKNIQYIYAGIGVALAIGISTLLVSGAFAESRSFFKRGAHSAETQSAIHAAFESGDYDAYVTAVNEMHKRSVMTEEEFDRHTARMKKKQQIHAAFIAGDHDAYLQLTNGSIHQLSEAAFRKKAQMLTLKEAMKTAVKNRDYATFTEKQQALKTLLGDEYMGHRHGGEGVMTEEQFNALADKAERYGDDDFTGHRGHKYGKREHSKRWHGKSPQALPQESATDSPIESATTPNDE